jgi:hypothetical protein
MSTASRSPAQTWHLSRSHTGDPLLRSHAMTDRKVEDLGKHADEPSAQTWHLSDATEGQRVLRSHASTGRKVEDLGTTGPGLVVVSQVIVSTRDGQLAYPSNGRRFGAVHTTPARQKFAPFAIQGAICTNGLPVACPNLELFSSTRTCASGRKGRVFGVLDGSGLAEHVTFPGRLRVGVCSDHTPSQAERSRIWGIRFLVARRCRKLLSHREIDSGLVSRTVEDLGPCVSTSLAWPGVDYGIDWVALRTIRLRFSEDLKRKQQFLVMAYLERSRIWGLCCCS